MQREGLEVQDVPVDTSTGDGEISEAPTAPEISSVPEPDAFHEDLDRIDPIPEEYQLANGQWVLFERLRTRQFFAMLRIITRPALPALRYFSIDPTRQSMEQFTSNLIGLLVTSIPEAEDETIAFLITMVQLRDLGVTKEQETQARAEFRAYMNNPELDDLLSIVEAIVRREAPDLKALGERAISMWKLASKTGQTKVLEQAAKEQESSEASEALST